MRSPSFHFLLTEAKPLVVGTVMRLPFTLMDVAGDWLVQAGMRSFNANLERLEVRRVKSILPVMG